MTDSDQQIQRITVEPTVQLPPIPSSHRERAVPLHVTLFSDTWVLAVIATPAEMGGFLGRPCPVLE